MTVPIRRRIAAVVTCLVLAFAIFGGMRDTVSEMSMDMPPPADCDQMKHHHGLGCLILLHE